MVKILLLLLCIGLLFFGMFVAGFLLLWKSGLMEKVGKLIEDCGIIEDYEEKYGPIDKE